MKWTWNDGKDHSPTMSRSSLPCPNVIRDNLLEPLQHMADGRMYDSKRAMEKVNKEHGCVCVGNEEPKGFSPSSMPAAQGDVAEAYKRVRDGYKPDHVTEKSVPTESGWYE